MPDSTLGALLALPPENMKPNRTSWTLNSGETSGFPCDCVVMGQSYRPSDASGIPLWELRVNCMRNANVNFARL